MFEFGCTVYGFCKKCSIIDIWRGPKYTLEASRSRDFMLDPFFWSSSTDTIAIILCTFLKHLIALFFYLGFLSLIQRIYRTGRDFHRLTNNLQHIYFELCIWNVFLTLLITMHIITRLLIIYDDLKDKFAIGVCSTDNFLYPIFSPFL